MARAVPGRLAKATLMDGDAVVYQAIGGFLQPVRPPIAWQLLKAARPFRNAR